MTIRRNEANSIGPKMMIMVGGALSLVVSSPTKSTVGVVRMLVAAGLLVAVGALFDQGKRYTSEWNLSGNDQPRESSHWS